MLDQVIAERASRIELVMHAYVTVSVTDEGPGLAVEQTVTRFPAVAGSSSGFRRKKTIAFKGSS